MLNKLRQFHYTSSPRLIAKIPIKSFGMILWRCHQHLSHICTLNKQRKQRKLTHSDYHWKKVHCAVNKKNSEIYIRVPRRLTKYINKQFICMRIVTRISIKIVLSTSDCRYIGVCVQNECIPLLISTYIYLRSP